MTCTLPQPSETGRRPRRTPPGRMAELASLPAFFRLQGRPVVVVGGSEAAAWKAELLAASGARVSVYAPELDPMFDDVMATDPGKRIVWHARPWGLDCFDKAVLAVCDASTDAEGQALRCAARAAGVPVNIIDRPDFCDFQFGSIVNRSPAIVAISTDGAAPILGQVIRRRIETLLPASLAAWASLAKSIRSRVAEKLAPGAPRRTFWEAFSARAFATDATVPDPEEVFDDIDRVADAAADKVGSVTLVGAGPGDAELLTLKAVRALQAADVILFDDLVSDDVLELARREARRMLVGKRGKRESCRQDDINAMMVRLARSGRQVVRLKSGDPMIFGRAGEEIAELQMAGIPVSVVPGITSALAMAAALGVSLTHRDHAQSVRFVTGHSRAGDLPDDINWAAIADPRTTTIFYMGARTAPRIAERLQEHGLAPRTPAAICRSVSRSGGATWTGCVDDLASGVANLGIEDPILIGIGPVFAEARCAAGAQTPPGAARLAS